MAKKNRQEDPKYELNNMLRAIDRYIKYCYQDKDNPRMPIVKELCLWNGWNYNYLYQLIAKYPELSDAIDMVKDTKEVILERNGLDGTFNSKMAELSLAQLGWSKKEEINISATDDLLKTLSINDLRKALEDDEEDNECKEEGCL